MRIPLLVLTLTLALSPATRSQTCYPCSGSPAGPTLIASGTNELIISSSYGPNFGPPQSCQGLTVDASGDVISLTTNAVANAPVCFLLSPQCTPSGCFEIPLTATYTVDVGNGANPWCFYDDNCMTSPASTYMFATNGSGVMPPFNVPIPALPVGRVTCIQAGFIDPGMSPLGVGTSQAICIDADSWCNPNGSPGLLPLGNDTFTVITAPVGAVGFAFYGTIYQSAFVGSNGFLTFLTGDTDFTPTAAEMLAGPPRIAASWTDWDPTPLAGATGGVHADDQTPFGGPLCVAWDRVGHTQVPPGPSGVAPNGTSCVEMRGSGVIIIRIGPSPALLNLTTLDVIVGTSPGLGSSGPNNVDLSSLVGAPPIPISSQTALYEDFSTSPGGFDLTNRSIRLTPAVQGGYVVTVL